jgi:hypothetical protein
MSREVEQDMAAFYNSQGYEYRARYWRWLFETEPERLLAVARHSKESEETIRDIRDTYVKIMQSRAASQQ